MLVCAAFALCVFMACCPNLGGADSSDQTNLDAAADKTKDVADVSSPVHSAIKDTDKGLQSATGDTGSGSSVTINATDNVRRE